MSLDEKARVRRSLGLILPIGTAFSFLYGVFYRWQNPDDFRHWFIFAVTAASLLCWAMVRTNYLRLSALLYAIMLWAIMSTAIYYSGGMQTFGQSGLILVIFVTGLLLGGRYALILMLLSIASLAWILRQEMLGLLSPYLVLDSLNSFVIFVFYLIAGWFLLSMTMKDLRRALENASQELAERRQVEKRLSEQAEYLAALHETTLAIIDRLDLNSLLELMLTRAEALADTRHGCIDLVLPGNGASQEYIGHGIFESFQGTVLPIGQGIAGLVLQEKQTIVVDDYSQWHARLDSYSSLGLRALLATPLKAQGRILGIIELAYDDPQRKFTQKHIQQLEQFAELAALALDNVSLYQAAQTELAERTRTENALRESQSRLDLALSSANMGIWDWEIDADQIVWSERVYDILDTHKEHIPYTLENYFEIIHPDDQALVRQSVENCLAGIEPDLHTEYRIVSGQGESLWVESNGRLYRDEDGRPVRIAGTITDITERKQDERVIRDANANLKNYAEALERRSGLLQLGAEVARAATAILDSQALSQQVVEMVQKQFGLYYVGLFLVEEDLAWAILRAGTGSAGIIMLESGHRLEVGGASMVGWCIANRQARIALDVGEEAVRFNNPLLPDTRSELALPLTSRGEVLGALTIQSNKQAAFSQEDIATFETMADLLANAILNARLYDQVQRELEERKRAEDTVRQLNVELEARVRRRTSALKASEEKFRALAENNPLQIARYDRDGRYLYVNHLGQSDRLRPENVVGKTLREVFGNHPSIDFAEQQIRLVFDSGEPVKTEYELNGFVGHWSLAPEFDPQGNVVSVISTTLDITERKKIEEELHATNRELEAFSYSVSHDLRAPLRAIDGFTRILMDDFAGQIPEDGLAFLNRTRQAAQNMGQLIDDLLRLSRITRAELHNQPVDIYALSREIFEQLSLQEPGRDVKFEAAKGMKATGDERLLRVALENLLNNALKFTAKTPAPVIKVGKQKIKGKQAFYVTDNGVGFDINYANKLFGAFQRLHSAEEFPGTGIGLAIVQRIIHRHGGQVWAEGRPGEGATFYFTLD